MNTKLKLSLATLIIPIVALTGTLTACAAQEDISTDETRFSTEHQPLDYKIIKGKGSPDNMSVICVEGSAFLYVNVRNSQGSGPSVTRFIEQDANC